MDDRPTFGSLFAGIGGLDLGLERAGFECRWQVERDTHCRSVLERHWPDVTRYEDVRKVGDELERVDLVAGGFPCQPVSLAGKRLAQSDERWLWPEFARLVRVLRPPTVLVENVRGLLSRGFGDVLGDLADLGYDAEWDCIPAQSVGAYHRRDRIFLVAWDQDVSDPYRQRLEGRGLEHRLGEIGEAVEVGRTSGASGSRVFDRSPVADWLPEPSLRRVVDGVPNRVDRLRSLGNAVVPQVGEWVGRMIVEKFYGDRIRSEVSR